jgi:hypothetical protein
MIVQSLYDSKANNLNLQNIVNRTVTKYGEGNYHLKIVVSIVKNESSVRGPSKMQIFMPSEFSKWRNTIECETLMASAIEYIE